MSRLALVLSAGGARGAYEAGVIYYMRTGLPKDVSKRQFQIHTGTSVGAINTVGMAAYAQDLQLQGEKLKELWFSIRQESIYRRDFSATTHFLGSTLGGILGNFLTINPFQLGKRKGPHFNSFLDTTPLKEFLNKEIPWAQLNKNILDGPVDAVAINVTNLNRGHNELFLQKKPQLPYQGHYAYEEGPLKSQHVLASAAIPIIFPPIKIGDVYYADGGIKLFTPMSPAIQLGADRLLVIGLRKRAARIAPPVKEKDDPKKTPTISDQMGRLLNGLFIDRLEYDVEQLGRINTIIDGSEKLYGKDYLSKINARMKKEGYTTDIARRGLRKIPFLEIQPSEHISSLFINWFEKNQNKNFKFSVLEKTMVRILDIDPNSGSDLLSYLTFSPEYIRTLFDLGYEDAKTQRSKLIEIMSENRAQ